DLQHFTQGGDRAGIELGLQIDRHVPSPSLLSRSCPSNQADWSRGDEKPMTSPDIDVMPPLAKSS
ncbi:hypothetical protein, partial [Tardiphaga sp.]|uniref:hypothetical protein n=1 Tax=Tardiphaga sp. TaxID=1926292 RepID=UPI002621C473